MDYVEFGEKAYLGLLPIWKDKIKAHSNINLENYYIAVYYFKLFKMRSVFIILFSITLFLYSCEKGDDNNLDDIQKDLENIDPFTISPSTGAKIDLYTQFKLSIVTDYVRKNYSEVDRNFFGKKTDETGSTLFLKVIIDSLYILNNLSSVEIEINDSAGIIFYVSPLKSFQISSNVSLIVNYHYEDDLYNIVTRNYTKEYTFNTTNYDSLTQSIVYCEYPLYRQYNFLKNESNFCYIKPLVRPDFLLNTGTELFTRITDIKTKETYESEISYNENLKILQYSLPTSILNERIYKIDFIRKTSGIETAFYRSNYFRTSKFNTFSEKIANVFNQDIQFVPWEIMPCCHELTGRYINNNGKECLDFYEQIQPLNINHYEDIAKINYQKLVHAIIDTTLTSIDQWGYQTALELGYVVNNRPIDYIGYKPIKDFIYFYNFNEIGNYVFGDVLLSDSEILNMVSSGNTCDFIDLKCNISSIILKDINNFKGQAINDSRELSKKNEIMNIKICNGHLFDKYCYKLQYVLPGINQITYEKPFSFGPIE